MWEILSVTFGVGKYATDTKAALFHTLEITPLRETLFHPLLLQNAEAEATFDRREVWA